MVLLHSIELIVTIRITRRLITVKFIAHVENIVLWLYLSAVPCAASGRVLDPMVAPDASGNNLLQSPGSIDINY